MSINIKDLERLLPQLDQNQQDAVHKQIEWLRLARANQLLPHDDWTMWLILAGRGFGKTRTGAEKTREWSTFYPGMRIGIMGPTFRDTQKTMIEGESGLLSVIPEHLYEYNKKDLEIKLWNGSIIQGFTGEEPERLRGPQFHRFWLDEPAAMARIRDVKDQISFSLRLKHPMSPKTQQIWTTTPRPKQIIRDLVKESHEPGSKIIVSTGSSYENQANLTEDFFSDLIKKYEGTTLGRQEIHAELIDASESGIMKREWLKIHPHNSPMPKFHFVLLSADTAFTEKTENDFTAMTAWGVFRQQETSEYGVLLLSAWKDKLAYPDLKVRVIKALNTYYGDLENGRGMRPQMVVIEEKGSGISLLQDMKRARLPVRSYNPGNASKLSRAHLVAPLVRDGFVWIPENSKSPGEEADWAREFIEEITSYSGPDSVEHDDYLDTFTQMLAMVRDLAYITARDTADQYDDEDDMEDAEEGDRMTNFNGYRAKNPYV